MKIESSAISMTSSRQHLIYSEASSETVITPIVKASVANDNTAQYRQDIAEFSSKQPKSTKKVDESADEKSLDEYKLEIILKMLNALKHKKSNDSESVSCKIKLLSADYETLGKELMTTITATGANGVIDASRVSAPVVTQWKQTTVSSSFFSELENTAFQATGVAKTADGREISFDVSIEMTRAFCERNKSFSTQEYIYTDPLVINLNSNFASVSDQKFLFDINSDGQNEAISFTENGSGFLALDKNGDGAINNGSELFGTTSGNGFADLAVYDSDGNSWIDEADDVFKDLRVWTKDDSGNNVLLDLKEGEVGAIYLGNVSTEFSLNTLESNQTNGIIRSSGIFLKENGAVGTIQHVDMTM